MRRALLVIVAATAFAWCVRSPRPPPTEVQPPLVVTPPARAIDAVEPVAPAPRVDTTGLPDAVAEPELAAIRSEKLVDLPPLVIVRRHDGKRFELTPETPAGGFGEDDLALAREAWSWSKSHEAHDVHPRLLDLLYATTQHFEAPYVLLTSGYRPDKVTSYHAHGRAIDFQLPDVKCRDLAAYARTFGFVGVGLYPRTGSVHLDVREQSFFWISYAPRGVRWREQGILPDLARQMDAQAAERGVERPGPLPEDAELARQRQAQARKRRVAKRRAAKSP
jgi:hypothetical protein